MSKQIIAVTGATGAQGGGVVKYLLKDGSFHIRAITRNPESAKAKELAAKGVEIVKGDFDDSNSIHEAFKGAYGAFAVTDFWGILGSIGTDVPHGKKLALVVKEKEITHGKLLVDAAKSAGLKHFVFSTLEKPTLDVPHWDSKAEINDYLKASGVPHSSVYTAFYFQNFRDFFQLKKDTNGNLVADWPVAWSDGAIPSFDVEETGIYVLEAFKNPKKWIGNNLQVVSEILTPRGVVESLRKLSDVPIYLKEYSEEEFERAKDIPSLEELYLNMKWFYLTKGKINGDIEVTKDINTGVKSFEIWAREHVLELLVR